MWGYLRVLVCVAYPGCHCVRVCVCACVLCAVPCVVVTLWATSADSNNLKHFGSELFTTLWQGWFCVSAFYDPDKKLSVLVNSTLNHTRIHKQCTHTPEYSENC